MNVLFDRFFSKSLDKITDQTLKERIATLIETVEHAATLRELTGIKKIEGYKTFYSDTFR